MEKTIGVFRLISMTSRGNAVEVWRAEDTSLRREVILRLVREGAAEETRRAFEESVRAGMDGQEPGTLLLLDRSADGRPYAVYAGARAPGGAAGPETTRVRRPRRKRWLLPAALAGAVIIAGAAVALIIVRPWAPPANDLIVLLPVDASKLSPELGWIDFGFESEFATDLAQARGLHFVPRGLVATLEPEWTPAQAAEYLKAGYVARVALSDRDGKPVVAVQVFRGDGTTLLDYTREHDPKTEATTVIRDMASYAASSIVHVVQPKATYLQQSHTVDSRAWELFVKGISAESVNDGAALIQQALAIDPSFLYARRVLYVMYLNQAFYDRANYARWVALKNQAYDDYRKHLDAAPPDLIQAAYFRAADAHNLGDFATCYKWGTYIYQNAPDYGGDIRYCLWDACVGLGKIAEAHRYAVEDVTVDPTSTLAWENYLADYFVQRRYLEGIEEAKKAVAKFPDDLSIAVQAVGMYIMAGKYDEARAAQAAATKLGDDVGPVNEGYIAALQGRRDEAVAAADARLAAAQAGMTSLPWQVPAIYAAVGMKDKAFEVMSLDIVDRGITELVGVIQPFDVLRDDPRLAVLLKKWGAVEKLPRELRR